MMASAPLPAGHQHAGVVDDTDLRHRIEVGESRCQEDLGLKAAKARVVLEEEHRQLASTRPAHWL